MMHVGDLLSTVEGVQYRGGYHEYRGGNLQYFLVCMPCFLFKFLKIINILY